MKVTAAALLAATRYEFLMQVTRRALWLVVLAASALIAFRFRISPGQLELGTDPLTVAASISSVFAFFLPLAFGILMSDRVPRERRLQTLDLLASYPAGPGVRIWGKFLGAGLATALPLLAGYVGIAAFWVVLFHGSWSVVAAEGLVFLGVALPGLLFVGGWALLSTEFLPAPVFSVLFVGYWFWGNFMPPSKMPTLSCTPFNSAGDYAAKGLFGRPGGWAGNCDGHFRLYNVSAAEGWMGIGVLLVGALVAVIALQFITGLRGARQ
jgi:ABC-2 type transport system permease protein